MWRHDGYTCRGNRTAKTHDLKIDMTPMVDLGFLLISFFVITTQLTEPRAMDFIAPEKGPLTKVKRSAALTLLPSTGGQLYYYYGDAEDANREHGLQRINYNGEKIREIIARRKKHLIDGGLNPADLFVMIKPGRLSNYRNVVDLLDEMIINDVKRYALTAPGAADAELIKKMNMEHH